MSAAKRMLKLLTENVGVVVSRDDLSNVADVHDWQRSIRSLRQQGWEIESVKDGYILHSLTQKKTDKNREPINQKLRYQVFQRDQSKCRRCGYGIEDGVKLMVDHKIPVEWGGKTDIENLWTLCVPCNLGKKHWFSDEDNDQMKVIMSEESGYKRVKKLFEENENVFVPSIKISVIAEIQDWPRTVRLIRAKENMNIQPAKGEDGQQGYIYVK
ncbi:5-methylcytosine-specific restriction endonuclease McrA [Bacillus sp. SORGH_AS 510]|uniref:HNH endonuclease n=1 Tax=Bacillus sp. SORGH_AS_0510 TaxID=3041771 RepID=UPI0027847BF9|nr:HNH endonuclease signature motif containing protein [Bacillus sp. SORGH_AS_0510]MDQ1147031.1 5-methylcytosine-specific restriction endonuclease McrA [Bacillus sp. SORGH_AS_0510]